MCSPRWVTLWILNLPNPTGSFPYFPLILATTHPLLTFSPHSKRGAVKFGFNPVARWIAASLGTREWRNRKSDSTFPPFTLVLIKSTSLVNPRGGFPWSRFPGD